MDHEAASPESVARSLGLVPHPEGGFYKEVYRSADQCLALPGRYGAGRPPLPYCTSIYYLAAAPDFSAFHRIKSDELWYFHQGTGIVVHVLEPSGGCRALELGPGRGYFGAVAGGTWFAAEPAAFGSDGADGAAVATGAAGADGAASRGRAWALVSCAVSPGFDYRDFELAERAALVREYPARRALIERLTRA